jgi:hypothetical protein
MLTGTINGKYEKHTARTKRPDCYFLRVSLAIPNQEEEVLYKEERKNP